MPEICQLLKNAIEDEENGVRFYQRLADKVDKTNKHRIMKIMNDEIKHKSSLENVKRSLHCG